MKRYSVPRLAFINKMDRAGADPWKVGGGELHLFVYIVPMREKLLLYTNLLSQNQCCRFFA